MALPHIYKFIQGDLYNKVLLPKSWSQSLQRHNCPDKPHMSVQYVMTSIFPLWEGQCSHPLLLGKTKSEVRFPDTMGHGNQERHSVETVTSVYTWLSAIMSLWSPVSKRRQTHFNTVLMQQTPPLLHGTSAKTISVCVFTRRCLINHGRQTGLVRHLGDPKRRRK